MCLDAHEPEPLVVSVDRTEALPLGSNASRRAVAWWSDGSIGEALRWFDDEILSTEGTSSAKQPPSSER